MDLTSSPCNTMNTDKHDYTTTHVSTEREREREEREGERRETERGRRWEGGRERHRHRETERQAKATETERATHRTAASLLTVFTGHHGIVAILLEADVAKVKDACHQGQHRQLRIRVQPYHLHGSLHK